MADLISVVVPVYNVATDLPRCLSSILEQTYPHIEIVAVDDGSPDGSGMILDGYAAKYPNVRVIHQENGGVTSARLRGVQEASGQWIGFVDGDDEIEPDMYERLLANAAAYDAEISHCGFQMNFFDGRVSYLHNTGQLRLQDRTQGLADLLDGTLVEPSLCNKLFRRALFEAPFDGDGMLLDVKINEDLLMNFLLFKAAKQSVFEDWCPYHYIVRGSSASRAKLNEHRIYDPIRVKEQIMKTAEAELLPTAQKAYLTTCIAVYNSIILAGRRHYEKDRCNVRGMILEHVSWRRLLSRKQQLLAMLIQYAPQIYRLLYNFYASHILKNPYI